MKNFLLFFTKKSVLYFIFACLFYLLFLVVGFNVVNYFSPENSKSLESIIAVVGVIFTGMVSFIYEREKEQSSKLYVEKIQSCQDFFKILEEIIVDNVVKPFNSDGDEVKKIFFAISRLRMHFEEENIFEIIEFCTDIIEAIEEMKKEKIIAHPKLVQGLIGIAKIFKEDLQGLAFKEKKENLEDGKKIAQGIGELIAALISNNLESSKPPVGNKGEDQNIQMSPKETVWHVNVGEELGIKLENQYRCWEDMKKFNFWSAGGGKRYVDGAKKLNEENIIYAYISGKGYVGKGIVRGKAKIVDEFFKENNIVTSQLVSKLFKEHLEDKNFEDFHNEEKGEYAVKVEWVIKKDRDTAYKGGIHISPQTICIMNPDNLKKLEKDFV